MYTFIKMCPDVRVADLYQSALLHSKRNYLWENASG